MRSYSDDNLGWSSHKATVSSGISSHNPSIIQHSLRKMILKVRNVLENQSPRKTIGRHAKKPQETITLQTDARQFEAFLRSIGRCDSLLDARRLKNDIGGEIRRTRALLGITFHSREMYTLLTVSKPNMLMRIGLMERRRKMS